MLPTSSPTSVNKYSITFSNDYPPKYSRSHHINVNNINILPFPKVITSDKSCKNINHKIHIYTSTKKDAKHIEKPKSKFLPNLPRTSPSTGTPVINHEPLSQPIAPPVPPKNTPLLDATIKSVLFPTQKPKEKNI